MREEYELEVLEKYDIEVKSTRRIDQPPVK